MTAPIVRRTTIAAAPEGAAQGVLVTRGNGLTVLRDVSWIRVVDGVFGYSRLNRGVSVPDPVSGPVPKAQTPYAGGLAVAPVAMWQFDDGPWEQIYGYDVRLAPAGKTFAQVKISALYLVVESAGSQAPPCPGQFVRVPGQREWIDGGTFQQVGTAKDLGVYLTPMYRRLVVELNASANAADRNVALLSADPWQLIVGRTTLGSVGLLKAAGTASIITVDDPPMYTVLEIEAANYTGEYRVWGER